MAMAFQLPILKWIDDQMGINFDDTDSGKTPDRKG